MNAFVIIDLLIALAATLLVLTERFWGETWFGRIFDKLWTVYSWPFRKLHERITKK